MSIASPLMTVFFPSLSKVNKPINQSFIMSHDNICHTTMGVKVIYQFPSISEDMYF